MADKEIRKSVNIVNDKGGNVMAMNSMKREGDRIVINGILMGAWPSDMFVGAEDVSHLVGMIFKSPSVIFYVLSLPFILPRVKKEKQKKEEALRAKK